MVDGVGTRENIPILFVGDASRCRCCCCVLVLSIIVVVVKWYRRGQLLLLLLLLLLATVLDILVEWFEHERVLRTEDMLTLHDG